MFTLSVTDTFITTALEAHLECALWSSTDDDGVPLDANFTIFDFTPAARVRLEADLRDFAHAARTLLEGAVTVGDLTPSDIGHDLWLTRNGHGAGFFDRGLGNVGDALTGIAYALGTVDLYVTDSGRVDAA